MPRKRDHPLVRCTLRDLRDSLDRGFAITRRNLLRLHRRRMADASISPVVAAEQLSRIASAYGRIVRRFTPR